MSVCREQPKLVRSSDGLCPAVDVQLAVDISGMFLHGAHRDHQLIGDFLIGQAFGQAGQDFLLTVGQ